MKPIRVGLVADPAQPAEVAKQMSEPGLRTDGTSARWKIEVITEPFTTGSENVQAALARLGEHASERDWDLVVGLTELPLRDDDGRYLVVETDPHHRRAVLSLPALGGLRMRARASRVLHDLVRDMA